MKHIWLCIMSIMIPVVADVCDMNVCDWDQLRLDTQDSYIEQEQYVKAYSLSTVKQLNNFQFDSIKPVLSRQVFQFTPSSWSDYLDALTSSGNMQWIVDNHFNVQAWARGDLVVLENSMDIDGSDWLVMVPIEVEYDGPKQRITQPMKIKLHWRLSDQHSYYLIDYIETVLDGDPMIDTKQPLQPYCKKPMVKV